MRRLALVLLLIWPLALMAQDATEVTDDRGYIQALLEDNLSDAGRTIKIEGFAGALSSAATIEELTIADDDGVWLTIRNATLAWNRGSLLRGAIDIDTLSAEEILLPRGPKSSDAPKTEAGNFALPELPVSVRIGKVLANKVTLGAPILGEEATVSLDGAATLANGEGDATLKIVRTDGKQGQLSLAGRYANETEILALDLKLSEAAGGIVSRLLNLPGQPQLQMEITGEAPVSDYAADITLDTDRERRLAGRVSLRSETPEDTPDATPTRIFTAEIGGDVSPLFAPDLRDFFGPDIRLKMAGFVPPTGGMTLETLTLNAAEIALNGSLVLRPGGLPQRFDLSGQIAPIDGSPVRLPLTGPATSLERAQISARFDADAGEVWDGAITMEGLTRDTLKLGSANLIGSGVISGHDGLSTAQVLAGLRFALAGIETGDAAIDRALGDALDGNTNLIWAAGAPLVVKSLSATGAGLTLDAAGMIENFSEGFPMQGTAHVVTTDLARFSDLAGRDLSGAIDARLSGRGALLGGRFDVRLTAQADALGISEPRLDPLLRGTSELLMDIARDQNGTRLSSFKINNEELTATAAGQINSTSGMLGFSGGLTDLGHVDATLSGPATLKGTLSWAEGTPVRLSDFTAIGAGATMTGDATLDPALDDQPLTLSAMLDASDLGQFSGLAGRSLRGKLEAQVTAEGSLTSGDVVVTADAKGQNLGAGLGDLDKLIAGASTLTAELARTGGIIAVRQLAMSTPQLTVNADGKLDEATGVTSIEYDARLANLGLLTPDFPGPATAKGTAQLNGDIWLVALDATGPAGTTAKVMGTSSGDLKRMDLGIRGTAPLGLANSFIAPRAVNGLANFDLRLNGPLRIESLTGRVNTTGARLSAPTLSFALTELSGDVQLVDGQARINASANSSRGGRVTLVGPVGIAGGNLPADLTITLSNLRLNRPGVYKTTINGELFARGPLTGGGKISGTVDVGETELRIAGSGLGAGGELPPIIHVNESAAVRLTQKRAGMLDEGETQRAKTPPLGLDLLIRAPNQIFVRGRGLDAEMGGQLRIAGTTSEIIPIGQFDLIRGRLDILGKRIDLSEGQVRLQGDFDPTIRLVASTQTDEALVQIVTEGQLDAPEISFVSQPEMPEDEVLARLIFGRPISQISPLQAAQLASAVATLAGSGGNGIVGRLRQNFGLDDLDVTSSDEGTAQLRVGKYISDNIYTDVTVDTQGKSEINLNLDVIPNVTVKGSLNNDGDTSLGVFFEKDY